MAKEDCTFDEAIENIDIGGPAMVRSAAKNHAHVAVVTDPADYPSLAAELTSSGGALSPATRLGLAKKAFSHTAAYDGAISNYLTALETDGGRNRFPARLNLQFDKVQDLRYGENPHQDAAFYRDLAPPAGALAQYVQIQGKELSYNNIGDADAAWECVKTFDEPACVIVKHANPCGAADRRYAARGLSSRVQHRSDVRVRRHHRLQPSRSMARRPMQSRSSSWRW